MPVLSIFVISYNYSAVLGAIQIIRDTLGGERVESPKTKNRQIAETKTDK